jgi:hypothetical protein
MEADSEQIDSLLEQPIDQENQHQPKEALSKPKSKKYYAVKHIHIFTLKYLL